MHFLLSYDFVPEYLERRDEFRDAHLAHVQSAVDRGELILGGAFANLEEGAALIFKADALKVAADFAKSDPYQVNGLVAFWRVRELTTVVGQDAALAS